MCLCACRSAWVCVGYARQPAMRAGTHDAVQTAALQGLIKVVGNMAAAAAFLEGPAFPALLAVSRTRGTRLHALLAVALARIFEAAGSQQAVMKVLALGSHPPSILYGQAERATNR
jgi:hypothetical protein